jgi:hypothetical protein
MSKMLVDPLAQTYGLHPSLLIPIGSKTKEAIEKYVGSIDTIIGDYEAFVVNFTPIAPPNGLPVWNHIRSTLIVNPVQIWVDVDFRNYRKVYLQYNKEINKNDVIDHIMNRRFAKKLGYRYVRLLHVSRGVNSSAGKGGESMAFENIATAIKSHSDINKNEIEYADPADLSKMLNIKIGGWGLDAVRDHHFLFYGS